MPDRPRRILAALAAALCLTACGPGDSGGSGDAGPGQAPTAWPQPVDGKLTEAMCDVLTPDDFLAVGVDALRWEERAVAPDISPNAVRCHALGGHFLWFTLQPDPVSADLYFQWLLHQQDTAPTAENHVPGADQSWFATGGTDPQLFVRRGALVLSLSVGFAHDDTGFDPRAATATLAGQALERLPDVGRVATGKPHEMVLTVTGKDTAQAIVGYTDPITVEAVQETVTLPWNKKIQFPAFGRPTSITLNASAPAPVSFTTLPSVTCGITIDGTEEERNNGPGPSTFCYGSYAEPR
ncbi:hypothetical protein [Catenuloplanes indicus]|uniref:Uncharacterized protein n=1 Tax=Catenuloplanes indicus TaxID=137267 RepID=A0AAE4B212_9ACTN|nr:hypothetical protein [Catenuloplanes indicus]MDQ0370171.1 hypothetical protein [Catenuloplanes indicus]